jgi:E3 ubiquitin-protein ligase HOS1
MRREQVLERLALLDPQELIEEAKVEVCRATRDLRSCGRPVHHVLTGCGHACLCAECRKRCDYCPICRTPVSNKSVPDQLRLYELCVEAGLVVRHDDDDDDGDEHHHHHPADVQTVSPPDDVRRLRVFFDVALDNNLVALVCHCILKNPCTFLFSFSET